MVMSIWQRSLSAIGIFFLSAWLLGVRANDLQTASVYVDAGRFSEAVGILKNYAARDEDESKINLLTGKIYLAIDKPAKALAFFELADSLSLDSIDAQLGIALCELKLGKFAVAKRFADSINRIDKEAGEPLYIHALIMARTGKMEEAISSIEQASKKQPDSDIIAIASARFYALTGDVEKAKRRLSTFIARKPAAASAHDLLGELHQKTGDLSAARAARSKALNLYNDQGDSYRVAVLKAWLEANPITPQPEKPPVEAKPAPEKKPPETVAERKPEPSKAKPAVPVVKPVMPDVESNIAVQRFPFPSGVTIIGGSGFIVDAGRKVVTNRHVVEGGKEFAIRTGLGEVIKARLVFTSSTDDIAVLELAKPLPADRAIPSSSFVKPQVGRNVVVMGYPLWYLLGEGSPSLTNGVVSKRTGLRDDAGTFQITAKVNKGNSGGPVFDMRGNVVGITVGKLDIKKIGDDQGFLPEDVNFAIHVDRLPKILNISATSEEQRNELSAEELYQSMVGKVVMVATYK
ncbi:MAG: trypsin-like peptidase domain-containing protein [Burkholderiaceae bacterium]|jgi:serine protease Do